MLEVSDLAVATSGTYRRGEHIVDPATRRRAARRALGELRGPDLAVADALATAAFAMGDDGAAWLARQHDVEAMVIDAAEQVLTTPGFDALRV